MNKFIVLSEIRTGSGMLTDGLSMHSQIKMGGECLCSFIHPELIHGDDVPFVEYLLSFLDGFKVHRSESLLLRNKDLHNYFREHTKIIFLTRNDKLEQYVSARIANITDIWDCHSDNIYDIRLRIDIGAMGATINYWRTTENYFSKVFPERLDVEYEDLRDSYQGVMHRVFTYLEAESHYVPITTFKQNTRPLTDIIVNYDEVLDEYNRIIA